MAHVRRRFPVRCRPVVPLVAVAIFVAIGCGAGAEGPKPAAPAVAEPARDPGPASKPCTGALAGACVDTAVSLVPSTDPARVKRALGLLEQACEVGGDARGCGYLAAAYASGSADGAPQDPKRIATIAERACRGSDARGCSVSTAFADALIGGRLGEPDAPRAITLYRVACAAGEPRACLAMGRASADGGVEGMHDPEKAVSYFKAACDHDIADGCAELAIATATGRGTAKDETGARALAVRACEQSSSDGCAALGVLADKGLGGPSDPVAATAAFERACSLPGSQQRSWSCARVAYAHETGRGVRRDSRKSSTLYERGCTAATHGATSPDERDAGCILLAVVFEAGNGFLAEKNEALSLALYNYLCDGGSGNGCSARGAYFERRGKRSQARADFQRACKKGVAEACARAR